MQAGKHALVEKPLAVTTAECEEMIAGTMRFPGGRLAQFSASFGAADLDTCRIAGTEGEITVEQAFVFQNATRMRLVRGDDVIEKSFHTDQIAGQTDYFSDCILAGRPPVPDGGEGLADVRALLAIEEAARTGQPQRIATAPRPGHPGRAMIRDYRPTDRRLVF
jgi:predicted dehydrogenase